MNRYILLVLFALLGCMKLSAQEYKYVPFVREGMEWCYFADGHAMTADYDHFSLFRIEGDTLIAGTTYKKCNSYNVGKNGKLVREGYFREENKKVYFLYQADISLGKDGERLLYDFTPVQIGDSLILDVEFEKFYITKIDTLTIDGTLRKRFWMDFEITDYRIGPFSYTEGIGQTGYEIGLYLNNNLLYPFEDSMPSISAVDHNIVYVKRSTDGVFEYLNEKLYNDFLASSIESVSSSSLKIAREDGRWVLTLPQGGKPCKIEVMDATGRMVWSKSVAGNTDTLGIPTADFVPGTYIVVLTAQSGKMTQKVVVQ